MVFLNEKQSVFVAPKKDGSFVALDYLPATVCFEFSQLDVMDIMQFSQYLDSSKNLMERAKELQSKIEKEDEVAEYQKELDELVSQMKRIDSQLLGFIKSKIVKIHNTKGKFIKPLDSQYPEMYQKVYQSAFLTEEDLDFLE